MAFSTKIQIINAKVEQLSGGSLTLSGNTTIADSGSLQYATHPTFINDVEIVDKKYVDDNIVSGGTYNLASPSTVTVGGIIAGTTLTGKTSNQILKEILVPYLLPTFSSFSINAQTNPIEVGSSLSGIKLFNWSTTNSANVAVNSINIRDVNTNTLILTGSANDGAESADIGTIVNTTPISQAWRAESTNTSGNTFQSSNYTLTSLYPYFYGKVNAPGAAGANRPAANIALVTGGTKVIASSTGTITIPFASGSDDYLWFAFPDTSPAKTKWYENALNNGDIGGSVTPGGNLFPAESLVSVSSASPVWGAITYRVYIANYQTAAGTLELRNS